MKGVGTYLKSITIALAATVWLSACGGNKLDTGGAADAKLPARTIIKNHYSNELDFKTLRGRVKIDYDDGSSAQSFGVSFRMEKDKTIWMSATLSVVKVLITPERVSFYNKLDNTYFDGDFSYLSDLLGTDLNFEKVQNLLLGQAIFDLKNEKYRAGISNDNYELKPEKEYALFKRLFQLEPKNYKMALQQISQPELGRLLNVDYKTYQKIGNRIFPDTMVLTALERDERIKIEIEYRNIEFDQNVSFPYSIPRGYKDIADK